VGFGDICAAIYVRHLLSGSCPGSSFAGDTRVLACCMTLSFLYPSAASGSKTNDDGSPLSSSPDSCLARTMTATHQRTSIAQTPANRTSEPHSATFKRRSGHLNVASRRFGKAQEAEIRCHWDFEHVFSSTTAVIYVHLANPPMISMICQPATELLAGNFRKRTPLYNGQSLQYLWFGEWTPKILP